MNINRKIVLFLLILFAAASLAFADNSLVSPSVLDVSTVKKEDITAQITIRELLIDINNLHLRDINKEKIAFIDKEKLSWWDQMWNAQIKEYDRQIKVYEDENKRYNNEIKQFNAVLRRRF